MTAARALSLNREVPDASQAAATCCIAHDYADPGKPRIAWNDAQARAVLVDALVTDAIRLLAGLPEQPLGDKAANAVGILALVAGQDVEPADDSDGRDGRWRIAQRTAPDRMVTTVDSESRHVLKTRAHRQDGFKAHLAVEPETGLLTAVALRPGSATCSSLTVRGRPGRGSSARPASRSARKRRRHFETVSRDTPTCSATTLVDTGKPSASIASHARISLARSVMSWPPLRRRIHR